MPIITKEQILDAIAAMSVLDVAELISMMEKKFGISASSFNTINTNASSEVEEEKTEFDVVLSEIGANKIAVIKAVRSAMGLGLKEAKDLVESAPVTLRESISKQDSDLLKKILEEAGASVELR